MHKNKKADWNWLVGAAIATLILVITVFWIGIPGLQGKRR
jgi:hypothetical protein